MILAILAGLVVLTAASHQQSDFDESNTTLSTPQDVIYHLDMEIKALKGKMEKNGETGVLASTVDILQQTIQTMEWMIGTTVTNESLVALKSTVDAHRGKINAIETMIDLPRKRCIFRATFKQTVSYCEEWKTVIFDSVVTNTGNAYNPTTGVFTAPYRGDYVLAYQTYTYGSGTANWDLYINNKMALRARSQTSGNTSNESVLPVTLQAGDRVYVKSRDALVFWGTHHSFFAGLLVSAF